MQTALQCILIALLFSGCDNSRWLREFEVDEKSFDAEVMKQIQDDTGLVFPEGTRGLNFRFRPPIDPAFVAKLEIPRAGRDHVLKQIESIKDEKINVSGGLATKVSWWTPSTGTVIFDHQSLRSDNEYLRVVLTEEEDRIVLYISHAVF